VRVFDIRSTYATIASHLNIQAYLAGPVEVVDGDDARGWAQQLLKVPSPKQQDKLSLDLRRPARDNRVSKQLPRAVRQHPRGRHTEKEPRHARTSITCRRDLFA
jgi:hypothetical protein